MKYYVSIFFLVNSAWLMGSDSTVTIMPFSSSHSPHDMNEHVIPTITSLSELRSFINNHGDDQYLLNSLEYLKENVHILPQVFAEHFLTKHVINDPLKADVITSKITSIMEKLPTSDTDNYHQHILNLVLEQKPSLQAHASFRNKPINSSERPDPVDLLGVAKSLEGLVAEELANDNQQLKSTNSKKDLFARGYQGVIAFLTVLSVVVPIIQQYLGNSVDPIQTFSNCSHI